METFLWLPPGLWDLSILKNIQVIFLLIFLLIYPLMFFFTYLSDIFSNIIFWYIFWNIFWYIFYHSFWYIFWYLFSCWWGPVLSTLLGNSARELPGWGPALPTVILRSRLRPGAAHCDVQLAIETRRCPLQYTAEEDDGGGGGRPDSSYPVLLRRRKDCTPLPPTPWAFTARRQKSL